MGDRIMGGGEERVRNKMEVEILEWCVGYEQGQWKTKSVSYTVSLIYCYQNLNSLHKI